MGLGAGLGPKEEPLWKKLLIGGVGGAALGATAGAGLAGAAPGTTVVAGGTGGAGAAAVPVGTGSVLAAETAAAPSLALGASPVATSGVLLPGATSAELAASGITAGGAPAMSVLPAAGVPLEAGVAPVTGIAGSGGGGGGVGASGGYTGGQTAAAGGSGSEVGVQGGSGGLGGNVLQTASTPQSAVAGEGTVLLPNGATSTQTFTVGESLQNALVPLGEAVVEHPLLTGSLALGAGAALLPGGENVNEDGGESRYERGDNSWSGGGSGGGTDGGVKQGKYQVTDIGDNSWSQPASSGPSWYDDEDRRRATFTTSAESYNTRNYRHTTSPESYYQPYTSRG